MISKKPLYVQQPSSYVFLGFTMQIHLSGVQTGDEFSLIGATMPPGGDGGLHMHTREDESVHLLEGCLDVTIGEETFTMQAGQTYFAPRNIPHRLRNIGNVPARAAHQYPRNFRQVRADRGHAGESGRIDSRIPGP